MSYREYKNKLLKDINPREIGPKTTFNKEGLGVKFLSGWLSYKCLL